MNTGAQNPEMRAISVSELNRQAKTLLEDGIARVWVEGEVSNLSRPASGHVYFSLKDNAAQVSCAWFRQRQRGPTNNLKNGDQVLVFGKVSIYEARGNYQMIIERLEPAGEGELRRKFEALKKKLAAEGLFDEAAKQPIPTLPERIGVVTSPSGAAIRDILTVLQRRFPAIPVVVYPAAVQGVAAKAQIVDAIDAAVRRNECDVVIVGRGGGSLEDMWPFNEEDVAHAIYECPIPVVSAVGHEIDFTIADFVADVRAPTPSGAAELVVPDQADWRGRLDTLSARIGNSGRRYLEDRFQAIDWLGKRLSRASPAATVARQRDWLGNLQQVMLGAVRTDLAARIHKLTLARSRLLQSSPALVVQRQLSNVQALQQRLHVAGQRHLERPRHRLNVAGRALHSVSPLATLDRGYSIVSDADTGTILTNAKTVQSGRSIRARLASGTLLATVTGSKDENDNDV
ncbi:MAG: exodeoxyribonuclease VII large subunit [Woeseiaceae bacterium]